MNNKIIPILFFGLFIWSCTQLLEDDEAGKNTFASDDGCVYCHTNEARLKALAPPEENGGGAGGG